MRRSADISSLRPYGWGYLFAHALWWVLWKTPGAAQEWTVGVTAIALALPAAVAVGLLTARWAGWPGPRSALIIPCSAVGAGFGLALVYLGFGFLLTLPAMVVGWFAVGSLMVGDWRGPGWLRAVPGTAAVVGAFWLVVWAAGNHDHLALTEAAMSGPIGLAALAANRASRLFHREGGGGTS